MTGSQNRNRNDSLGNSVVQASNLLDSAYKNQASLPTQSENDAQLFADIGKNFSAPGDRPRGALRNLGAGLAKGMEYGLKSRAIEEKKENFGKYQKEYEYLKKVQNEVVKQNQWYADQEKRLETVRPFAVGGLEISYSGMPYDTGNERMRNVMEQAKIADPTIQGDYIGYVPNTPIVNLRDKDGNIIAYSLSNLVGEDVVKRVQGNYVDQQKLDLEKKYAPVKYQVMGDRIDATIERNNQAATKINMKLNETLGKKIDASREFLEIAPKMKDIVENHPDIFQSAIDATWRESTEPGFTSNMLKAAQHKWNPEKVAALTAMIKYINKMTLDVANGFSRPNMFIEKIGSKAVPNLDMSPEGFSKVLGEMVEEKRKDLENNQRRLELFDQQEGKPLSKDYQRSTADVVGNEQPVAPWASLWKESQ
jgi:hypothetical protein